MADLKERVDETTQESDKNSKGLEGKVDKLGAEQRRLQEDLLRVVEHCQEFENGLYKAQKNNEELVRQMKDMEIEEKNNEKGEEQVATRVANKRSRSDNKKKSMHIPPSDDPRALGRDIFHILHHMIWSKTQV